MTELFLRKNKGETDFSESRFFFAQIALVKKSSVGRSFQVKDLRMCSVLLSAFGGPST